MLICIATFMISLNPETMAMAISYFMAIMTEVFLYCYLANDVIVTVSEPLFEVFCLQEKLQSTAFADYVYTSGWHLLNVSRNKDLQKAMSLLILRAQRPVKMTVGNFGFLTLEFYIKMVKFSFSIYTFLGKTLK
ncbi:odorant receptor 2a-like isoform X1 [Photinus pyralis]|uniref:odorant receptor 2a-like isoform X1 n=1 Tax=Photinus pyralis TaxID=7054 RepID=UPI0012675289|nr:odorant receptor 2a-like isoform X1 [Photinus pyralis]